MNSKTRNKGSIAFIITLIIIQSLNSNSMIVHLNDVEQDDKDTLIKGAILIDTLTEKSINYLPSHSALSLRFIALNSVSDSIAFDVLIFAPERYRNELFKVGRIFNIFGKMDNKSLTGVLIFPVSKHTNEGRLILTDSIKLIN